MNGGDLITNDSDTKPNPAMTEVDMSIEIRMKMSPLETGKLYMKSVQMERQLAEANKAMMRAKTTKGWDSIPHEIHKHIDAVFEAIARE